MKKIILSARLAAIAQMVPPSARVSDVGTDHGRLPIFLLQHGLAASVLATDISQKPLRRAVDNAAYWGVTEGLSFRQCDGLSAVGAQEVDTVIIAGMGGGTIADILAASPWAARGGHRLILQPMSSVDELRRRLYQMGLSIAEERLVRDEGRIYSVMLAASREDTEFEPWEAYISKSLMHSGDALLPEYKAATIRKLQKALKGAQASAKEEDRERAAWFSAALSGLSKQ